MTATSKTPKKQAAKKSKAASRVAASDRKVTPVDRQSVLIALSGSPQFDVVVIGGGATGLGIAVDAATRGHSVLVVDAQDFAAGTSSRSTKLIHGGVRYMKHLREWGMVRGALEEQRLLLRNAGGLVRPLGFVVPAYRTLELPFYGAGVGLYSSFFAGGLGLLRMRLYGRIGALAALPGIRRKALVGAVKYWDAQFDDARMAVALLHTAVKAGALAINYTKLVQVDSEGDRIRALVLEDQETKARYRVGAKVVFNCTGPWTDTVRRLVDPACDDLVRISRGSHIVVDRSFLPSENAMVIPKTRDGRVLFCIPWHGMLEIGTTDIEQGQAPFDPEVTDDEVDFMMETANRYLQHPIEKKDVRARFCGLRPLLNAKALKDVGSADVSREHAVLVEFGNLITVTGGKWTSYRKMAEDAVNKAEKSLLLEKKRGCMTRNLPLVVDRTFDPETLEQKAAGAEKPQDVLSDVCAYAEYAAKTSGARTAKDVLYRRLRVGQMNEAMAAELMPAVAETLKKVLGN